MAPAAPAAFGAVRLKARNVAEQKG